MIEQDNLVRGLRAGDKQAIDEVYRSAYPLIKVHILRNSGEEAHAEDIFQEALIVLFQKLRLDTDFTLSCSISTYLFEISRRLWLKHLHKHQHTFHIDSDAQTLLSDKVIDTAADLEEYDTFNKKLASLSTAMQALGEPCASILKAYYNDQKSMSDIASAFGYTNESNAKNQKYKCLLRLKKIFFDTYQ